MTVQKMGGSKRHIAVSVALFSGLGLLVWLLLANYNGVEEEITDILGSLWTGLFLMALFNLLGFLTVRVSTWLNAQYLLNARNKWKIALMYFLVMLMFFFINYSFLVAAKLLSGIPQPFVFPNGGVRILILAWLVEMEILGLLLTNRAMVQNMDFRQKAARLQEENMAARYVALQNQLNPHFLFNSFNTLISEIEYNPQRAALFTRRLSDVYRYVLQAQKKKVVSLREELDFSMAFLFLHKVRLGDCIQCNPDISDEYMEYRLPPLTLQLLLENITKHNIISNTRPMTISLAVEDDFLAVTNTLQPKKTESTGIGLSNLSERCRLVSGKDIVILQDGNCFTVKIPLLYE